MIQIIHDDLINHVHDYDAVLVSTNIHCVMRHGFQHDVMLDYPYVNDMNDKTKYGDIEKLGTVLICRQENEPTFVLLYVCENYIKKQHKNENVDYLSYDSLEKCLRIINVIYKNQRVASTILGCSRFDGNGNEDKVINMMHEILTDVDVDVYQYKQLSRDEKIHEMYAKESEAKKIDKDLYKKIRQERKDLGLKRKEKNNHVKY